MQYYPAHCAEQNCVVHLAWKQERRGIILLGDFSPSALSVSLKMRTAFQFILCLIMYGVSGGVGAICETMEFPLATPEYETATATAATMATQPPLCSRLWSPVCLPDLAGFRCAGAHG